MDISVFLNRNRIEKKNEFFAASESFRDGEEVILWEIRALSGSEEERIRSLCMRQVQKKNGGYIFSSDHSIPNSVSLENMKAIVEEVKRLGGYNK